MNVCPWPVDNFVKKVLIYVVFNFKIRIRGKIKPHRQEYTMSEETPLDPMRVLCQLIDKRGGVLLTTMKRVRIAYGSDRLGKNIRESIHQKLAQLGIGHYPRDLPQYQWDRVR